MDMIRKFLAQGRDKTPGDETLAPAVVRILYPVFSQVLPVLGERNAFIFEQSWETLVF